MYIARVDSAALTGIDAVRIVIEVHAKTSGDEGRFVIIGLGDSAVKEARDRVTSSIKASGFNYPNKILVNLAPAELKKEGSSFDLAIALGIMVASGQLAPHLLDQTSFHGELSIDGRIRPIRGVVALTIAAMQAGIKRVVVPKDNAVEAGLIQGVTVIGVGSLAELVSLLSDPNQIEPPRAARLPDSSYRPLLNEVYGQESAKRAMVIAASGGHNLLLIGPPGCGKSMLAERFPSILPPLLEHELLEVIKVHSVAGLPIESYLSGIRPFRSPHHVISDAGLVGGGTIPRPGEISLAHNGVLFLDEFPEYRRTCIEALRSPLERGMVQVSRARGSSSFPAQFQLIAAMNPCPCGRLGAPGMTCLCSKNAVQGYLRKLSQPILDRIDLHVELQSVPAEILRQSLATPLPRSVEDLREVVQLSRARQLRRFGKLNSKLSPGEISKTVPINDDGLKLIDAAAQKSGLSARGFIRTIRVAMTIADLANKDVIGREHVAEAVTYRGLERIESYCAPDSNRLLDRNRPLGSGTSA